MRSELVRRLAQAIPGRRANDPYFYVLLIKWHPHSLSIIDDPRAAGAVVARVRRQGANVERVARSIRRPGLQRPSVHAAFRFDVAFIVSGDGCRGHGLCRG